MRPLAALLLLSACAPPISVVRIPTEPDPTLVPSLPELHVLSDEEVATAGPATRDLAVPFPEGADDGSHLLDAWFTQASVTGTRVAALTTFVVAPRDGGAVECRTVIASERSEAPSFVPPSPRVTDAYHLAQRLAPHVERRCGPVSRPAILAVRTGVPHYDAMQQRTRLVPQTQLVTLQVPRTECHLETVTSIVTQWDWSAERHYTPPTLEYLTTNHIHEGEPVCYAAPPGAVTRVEGKVYADPAPVLAPAAATKP